MSIDVQVSLQDYEKLLLDDFCTSFLSSDMIDHDLPELRPATEISLLCSWSWTRKLAGDACHIYFSEDWVKNHRNSAGVAWPVMQRFWKYDRESFYNTHSRLALLLRDNPHLESRFINSPDGQLPMLRLHLSHEDKHYWRIVAMIAIMVDDIDEVNRNLVTRLCQSPRLKSSSKQYFEAASEEVYDVRPGDGNSSSERPDLEARPTAQITSILESFGTFPKFEIWSLVQMCCVVLRSSEDSSQELHASLLDCGFFEFHVQSGSGFINRKWPGSLNVSSYEHDDVNLQS